WLSTFSFLFSRLDCDPVQFTPGGAQIGYGTKKHLGCRGTQTVAPNSIMAWLKSPGRFGLRNLCANCHASARDKFLPMTRPRTRSTFPSTTAIRSPKQMLAIAAAV